MIEHLALVAAVALAACGSKSTSPATPAPPADPTTAAAPAPAPAPPPAPPPAPAAADADHGKELYAAELAAYDKAKPALAKYCASCHTKSGKKANAKKLGHFDMTSYPFGGEHAKSIGNEIRVVLAIDGIKKPSMPDDKPGSVKGDDLAVIEAWTEAWQAAGQAGVHPADPADKDDD